jgi:hypothetical protein
VTLRWISFDNGEQFHEELGDVRRPNRVEVTNYNRDNIRTLSDKSLFL